MTTLGDRVRALRLKQNKTLEDVAKIAKVSRQTIQRYETGIITNIPSDKVEAIAKALHTTPAYLMGWEDDIEPEYYIDPEVAEYAQEIYENPDLKVLFDASKKISKRDMEIVVNLVKSMKKEEGE